MSNRKEFKGNIPLVETSAHENINIEAAFLLLAHLMDKTKVLASLSHTSCQISLSVIRYWALNVIIFINTVINLMKSILKNLMKVLAIY